MATLCEKIYLQRGIRQGDPAPGYLFNFAANILTNQIKRSDAISGIQLSENHEVRMPQYADDRVLFLNSPDCLQGSLQKLMIFSKLLGVESKI